MSLNKESGHAGRKRREEKKTKEEDLLRKIPKLTEMFPKVQTKIISNVDGSKEVEPVAVADHQEINKTLTNIATCSQTTTTNENNALKPATTQNESTECTTKKVGMAEETLSQLDEKFNASDPGTWPAISDSFRKMMVQTGPMQDIRSEYSEVAAVDGRRLTGSIFRKKIANGEFFKRDWLLFGQTTGSLFCFPCILFGADSSESGSGFWRNPNIGLNDWRHVHDRVNSHENSMAHFQSSNAWKMLKVNMTKCSGIDRDIQCLYENELNYFRNILNRVVDVILFLATRNLPFRGSEEIFGSVKNGNFMGMLELLSKYDVELNTHISRLKSKSNHISYMSAEIQNELISILAKKVRDEVASEITTAKYFTIFFDATPDVRKREQFSECFRYVQCNELGASIHESFYEFFDTSKKTGEGISNAILERLSLNGMKIEDCRGQGYDNASNMSGIYKGVQARILGINSKAKFLPCAAHSLNLIGRNAAENSINTKKYFAILQEFYNFFSSSPARWEFVTGFMTVVPKTLSKTRWSERFDAVKPFRNHYSQVLNMLFFIESDTECSFRKDVTAIAKKIRTFDFVFWTCLWFKILQELEIFNQYLQRKNVFISNVVRNLKSLITRLNEMEMNEFESCYENATTIALENDISYSFEVVRIRKRNRKYFESETCPTSTEEIFNAEMSCLLSNILQEFEDRFDRLNQACDLFSFVEPKTLFSSDPATLKNCVNDLYMEYGGDFDPVEILTEIERFQSTITNYDGKIQERSVLECLSLIYQSDMVSMFPNFSIVLRLYLTLPITVAVNERSFSKLKLIETFLRSNISEERLSDLAVLSIESERALKIDFDSVIDEFAKQKFRKVSFKSVKTGQP